MHAANIMPPVTAIKSHKEIKHFNEEKNKQSK